MQPVLPQDAAAIAEHQRIRAQIEKHPCYCKSAHTKFARIHLPVAPRCNIQCNYCNRKYDCSNESRPGVTSSILSPQAAIERLKMTMEQVPNLSVVGFAGPGDALANPEEVFATASMVRSLNPDLILCLSTNGLALPELADEVIAQKFGHVTVTMNTINPAIGADIYRWVKDGTTTLHGEEGAALLHERQLAGIRRLTAAGVLVKVNTVMIPGINDTDIPNVASTIKAAGVFIHNIIPLICQPEHGTVFGEMGIREPQHQEIVAIRKACGVIMGGADRVMSHCKQCRADAIGMLGKDITLNQPAAHGGCKKQGDQKIAG